MASLFTYCAVIGGILFVGQLVLTILGIGGDETEFDISPVDLDLPDGDFDLPDGDFDLGEQIETAVHSDGWFVGILSIRSIIAAIAVFGLVGQSAREHFSPIQTIVIASLAGGAVLYMVGWTFKELLKIRSDGTVKIQDTIGCSGKVYLNVPAENFAAGKVTISVAGRTMEYLARTRKKELVNGTPVTVVAVLGPDMVEVEGVDVVSETVISSSIESQG